MQTLFDTGAGALFSPCRRYRYKLWRIWDSSLPLVMFIGLNPSTANEAEDDPTIKRVCGISRQNGFGGVYMLNCFPYISTDPQALQDFGNTEENDYQLMQTAAICAQVVFAWGDFKIVKQTGRDAELARMFPAAQALHINKNGSPKHPLYCKKDSSLIPFTIAAK